MSEQDEPLLPGPGESRGSEEPVRDPQGPRPENQSAPPTEPLGQGVKPEQVPDRGDAHDLVPEKAPKSEEEDSVRETNESPARPSWPGTRWPDLDESTTDPDEADRNRR